MTATGESAAYRLEGRVLDGWTVHERLELPDDHTGGAFSVGYRVVHESGTQGFLKAFDYAAALEAEDPPKEISRMTDAYLAERAVLEHCRQRRLSRVVRALAAGTTHVQGAKPDAVSYLIFEWADRDALSIIATTDPADHLPVIELSHHGAVGVNQLHSVGVSHQDIKASNFLIRDEPDGPSGRISDLGRAYMEGRPTAHDDLVIAGTPAYASPEQLYACPRRLGRDSWRQAADICKR